MRRIIPRFKRQAEDAADEATDATDDADADLLDDARDADDDAHVETTTAQQDRDTGQVRERAPEGARGVEQGQGQQFNRKERSKWKEGRATGGFGSLGSTRPPQT